MSDLYTGDYYITDGLDPYGVERIYGGAKTRDDSVKECALALDEYLDQTRRWRYWFDEPNHGFTFKTEKHNVQDGISVDRIPDSGHITYGCC